MRSLYFKVFVALWLVVMLVVGSNLLLTWILARQFADAETRDSYVQQYARQALESYLDQGSQGLHRWQRQLHENTGLRTLLLDPQIRNLSAEPLPPRLDSLIRHAGRESEAGRPHSRSPGGLNAARQREHPGQRPLGGGDSHPQMKHRSQRPLIWPIQHQGQNYLFVLLNPRALVDHLYSGQTLVWRLALSLSLVGLLSLLMARYLVWPIRQLQQASRQLADGQLDTRVSPALGHRRDELGQLAQEFDRMAEQIQTLIRGQQQLLRDVSHELRTPLARQRFALELARKKPGSSEALDRIEQQAEELDALIGEILMLTRLDSHNSQDPHSPTALRPLLQSLTAEFNIEQPRVRLQDGDAIQLSVDPKLIQRALGNILGNALKYSQAEVVLILEQDAREVRIRVQDQGPGIETAMLEKVFEPFVRTDQARSRQQGGWGLGLAIAARAVRQHRGQIKARNLDPHGLEVLIHLPR
ncbi:MAG: two-component system sensor histidine kinase CpxA [Motiliproteus sp.]|jgi:two-component system sensor histidine kinase CpxA